MAANWTLTMPRRARSRDWLSVMVGHVRTWSLRAQERRALGELDDRMLRDIGVDRASAHYEATKPFWQD